MKPQSHILLRFYFGEMKLGPGKVQLLEHIRDTGSISAAGRAMQMSYKRAWMLVEEMNAAFIDPVVESARGGANGGGATVTAIGLAVIAAYRAAEMASAQATGPHIETLQTYLRDIPERK
ncbi:MAG: LysR family transcriptional regulator [Cypionkella sp.]|uniref:winged helix-turn-helix domain-containing protein n=1 Tax=Cypionkella sp. TaxID=2811411 RepID=UPI002ABC4E67|nr:LysR family transcriptional regulator [Cypionkella sp.]MDZ4311632.1 LysR family transcriptional regulator [Cypionkella sp.]MDZ4392761.1 LysR family transcriptional regulator [Cypionkella sp.]